MELYKAVSRRMGIPEVVIRGPMRYMKQSRIFVVTFLGVLDPVQRILSTPQVWVGGCGVLLTYILRVLVVFLESVYMFQCVHSCMCRMVRFDILQGVIA